MKAFIAPGYRLRNARVEMRLVYTGFLVLATVGLVTMGAFQLHQIGVRPEQIATYYRGGERADVMLFPKTFRELVEVTHFHSFIMGLVYLVLAHLFLATEASDGVKRTMVVVGFVGLGGDLVNVWLIRYVSPAFAWPQVGFWLAEWASFAAYVGFPIREMWFDGIEELPPE